MYGLSTDYSVTRHMIINSNDGKGAIYHQTTPAIASIL